MIIQSNNNDCHFSILGFTAATGEVVMYVCIIKEERRSYKQVIGLDISIPFVHSANLADQITLNTGIRKCFPSSPFYYFCGKTVPYIVTYSSRGGIN